LTKIEGRRFEFFLTVAKSEGKENFSPNSPLVLRFLDFFSASPKPVLPDFRGRGGPPGRKNIVNQ
jgi:hypothetical protein